ncbi:MAG TPA: hypothetical protein VGC82_10080 [Rhodopila sp.]|jgi:hypothetical protein
MPEPVLPPAGYEHSDVTTRSALVAFPAILVGLLLVVLVVRWIYPGTAIDRRLQSPLPVFPSPRLQSSPSADMQTFLKQELARLNSGGWDDEAKGAGHIPIQEAMRRVAAAGIADWPK